MSSRNLSRGGRALAPAALALALGCGLMPPEQAQQGPAGQQPPGAQQPPTQIPPTQQPPATPGASGPVPPAGFVVRWQDDFESGALDATKWAVASGPRRAAVNTPDAVKIHDGMLTITTYTDGGAHKTGFLTTDKLFYARYGYYEARIRFQETSGEWCAFWLQSPNNGNPVGDPAKAGAEIDVVEHRANDQSGFDFRNYAAVTLNWDGYGAQRQNRGRVVTLQGAPPLQGQWHTYGVLWNETSYTFYLDGVQVWTTTEAVSQTGESLQLTCEVESVNDWAGAPPKGGYGSLATSTTHMDVDWVRIWQPPG
jgi:beta-glucanase (GH16 family)